MLFYRKKIRAFYLFNLLGAGSFKTITVNFLLFVNPVSIDMILYGTCNFVIKSFW